MSKGLNYFVRDIGWTKSTIPQWYTQICLHPPVCGSMLVNGYIFSNQQLNGFIVIGKLYSNSNLSSWRIYPQEAPNLSTLSYLHNSLYIVNITLRHCLPLYCRISSLSSNSLSSISEFLLIVEFSGSRYSLRIVELSPQSSHPQCIARFSLYCRILLRYYRMGWWWYRGLIREYGKIIILYKISTSSSQRQGYVLRAINLPLFICKTSNTSLDCGWQFFHFIHCTLITLSRGVPQIPSEFLFS